MRARHRRVLGTGVVASALAAALVCGGCAKGGDRSCFLGSPGAATELTLVARSVAGQAVPLSEGGEVVLFQPPQGGKVVFVGPRARNLPCTVQITASLRDEASGRIVAVEGRPVTLAPVGDGWGEPQQPMEINNYANIPACPNGNVALGQDLFDRPYVVRLRIEDQGNLLAETEARVTPRCADPATLAHCRCQCAAGYHLGDPCPVGDGGAGDGGTP